MGRPKKKVDVIEKVAPHTIKKCELIEHYVDEWARKILGFNGVNGRDGSKGIIYIDCMSNSGLYYDSDDNLVDGTALRVAKRLNDILPKYPDKMGYVMFNDISQEKIDCLKREIDKLKLSNITVRFNCGDGNEFIRELDIKELQKKCGTLLLYDPYQATIDWDAITPYLNIWGEVIINHMVSDTNRGASQATREKAIQKYQETYQQDIASIISISSKTDLNKAILEIIKKKTEFSKSKRYIASFPFFNRTNGLVYNLIHVSGNIEGLKLFKKVAWKAFGDKSSLKNTHGEENQLTLDFDGNGLCSTTTDDECYYVKDIAKDIFEQFGSRGSVKLSEIYQYLDEHPVFPSEGYKNEIKRELKPYTTTIPKGLNDYVVFIKN